MFPSCFFLQASDTWKIHFSKKYTVNQLEGEKRAEIESEFIEKLKVSNLYNFQVIAKGQYCINRNLE